jgi:predicted MPP superfamily phosphohydrolase
MKWLARALAACAALALLFLGVGFWNATRMPVVEQVRLPLAGLPPGQEIRVLHLTDTHFGYPDMRTGRLLRIVAQANALKPDLIVLTGDYMGGKILDKPRSRLEEALPPLGALQAPLGVYAVLGNHDEPKWTPRVMARQHWPKLLVNQHADVGPLVIVGLDSAAHGTRPDLAFRGVPAGKPVLLLIHEGDYLSYVDERPGNPALALAGHTHGGQVVLPIVGSLGNLLLGPPGCNRGLCQMQGGTLFVSSGIGTSVLPIRYGVPPEMVMITLYSPDTPAAAAEAAADHSTGRKSGTDR